MTKYQQLNDLTQSNELFNISSVQLFLLFNQRAQLSIVYLAIYLMQAVERQR